MNSSPMLLRIEGAMPILLLTIFPVATNQMPIGLKGIGVFNRYTIFIIFLLKGRRMYLTTMIYWLFNINLSIFWIHSCPVKTISHIVHIKALHIV